MAEKREFVKLPDLNDAPVVIMSRFKQPWSGLLAFCVPLLVAIVTWWIFFDPRFHEDQYLIFLAPTVGGLGLIGVLWVIWFDNWPYYNRLRKMWQIVLVGTAINLAIMALLTFVLRPIFTRFWAERIGITDEFIADYVGKSIFGALSGSCFSFATLWVSATMFWPFFKYDQPKRGIFVWIVGTIITVITWVAGFLFTADPTVTDVRYAIKDSYLNMLGLTQWTIFFSLLTLMVFEYWPWTYAKKQPYVGILAFIACGFLGYGFYLLFQKVAQYLFHPIFVALGGTPGFLITVEKSWTTMNISFADFLISAVIIVALFFDNWPKKYKQWINLLIRFLLVMGIGIAGFFLYYFFSPWVFGEPINHFIKVPTHFLVYFLWLELLFAYVWRKWPIYKVFKKGV